jgi:hypothetical protein
MRAAHADRERAADVLRAGFAEGRLTKDEYDERLDWALRAGTYGELERVVGDLPQGPTPAAIQPAAFAGYGYPPPPAPLPPYNGMATGAMVCGICCLFTGGITSIPAVILGHKARSVIRRTGERGESRATTGLVLGYIFLVIWLFAGVGTLPFVTTSDSGGDSGPPPVVVEQEPIPEDVFPEEEPDRAEVTDDDTEEPRPIP